MKAFRALKWLSKHRFHTYRPVFEKGANLYVKCSKCGKKKVIKGLWGYSPIDREWLEDGSDNSSR